MKTIQKLFVLGLFVAGSVFLISGCGDNNKKASETKPAAKTGTEPEKKEGDAPGNASTTPVTDGVTKVVFNVSGMS